MFALGFPPFSQEKGRRHAKESAVSLFKRIDNIELVTADPERAVRFYSGVLGFTVRARDTVRGGLQLA